MKNDQNKLHRRQFLKATGAASAVAGGAGLGLFGYADGKDPMNYTGWATYEGAHQTFDREKWAVDKPTYEKTGATSRADGRTEMIFSRRGYFMRYWKEEQGVEGLSEPYKSFYTAHPEVLELDLLMMKEIYPAQRADHEKYSHRFLLSEAWSNAMGAVSPEPVRDPPEKSDFSRRPVEKVTFKSPEMRSKASKS